MLNLVPLLGGMYYRMVGRGVRPVEQCREIDPRGKAGYLVGIERQQVCASYYLVEVTYTQLSHYLADAAGQIAEEIYHILRAPLEPAPQLLVLGSDTYGTGVLVAFAHHHAAKHDEGAGSETIFLGAEHCHHHDVARCLELAVGLQLDLPAQVVDDESLLRLG